MGRRSVLLELAVAVAIAAGSHGVARGAENEAPVSPLHDKDFRIEICQNHVTFNGMEVPVPNLSVGLRPGGDDGSPIRGPDSCHQEQD